MSRAGSRLFNRFLFLPNTRPSRQLRIPPSHIISSVLAFPNSLRTMTVVNGTGTDKPVLFLYVVLYNTRRT